MAAARKKINPRAFGSCWPSPDQIALLRACCLEGAPALEAWARWKTHSAAIGWDHLDLGSRRLLPLLYRNLARLGLSGEEISPLKNYYRLAWAANRLLFAKFRPILTALEAEKIPLMILKGAALAPLYYRDEGARPMSDVDFLFPPERAPQAFAVLRELGWQPVHGDMAAVTEITHSYTFKNEAGEEIDPHWHALHECCRPHDDDSFWEASVPLHLEGFSVRAMCPTDQLLHVCSHGLRWNRTPPLRWIADAAMIIHAAGPALSWDRLAAQASERRLSRAVFSALLYLQEALHLSLPASALDNLKKTPESFLEKKEFQWKTHPPGWWGPLPVEACLWFRLSRGQRFIRQLAGLPRYFRLLHNFPNYRKLLRYMFFLPWKHLQRKAGPKP
jgi:hypothetical protein